MPAQSPLALALALPFFALVACGAAPTPKPAPPVAADTSTVATAATTPGPATASPSSPSPAPNPAPAPADSTAVSTSAPAIPTIPTTPIPTTPIPTTPIPTTPTPLLASAAPQAKPAAKPIKIAARHILIQWMGCRTAPASVVRTRDQAYAMAKDVLHRLKAGQDFVRLADEFSDEPNAGARGGSLGRFGHGAWVREFEDAAFALQPGELSGIVESPYGFHIIQRTE